MESNQAKAPWINNQHGLVFMEKWPKIVRWLSILPVAILVFLFVKIFILGTFINVLSKHEPVIANYVGAVVVFLPYYCCVVLAAAAAPSKRGWVATFLTVLIVAGSAYIVYMAWPELTVEENESLEFNFKLTLILSFVFSALGAMFGIKNSFDLDSNKIE